MDTNIFDLRPIRALILCHSLLIRAVMCRSEQKCLAITEAEATVIAGTVIRILHQGLKLGQVDPAALEEWAAELHDPTAEGAELRQRLNMCTLPVIGTIDAVVTWAIDSFVAPRLYEAVLRGMGQEIARARLATLAGKMLDACYRQCVEREPRLAGANYLIIYWPKLEWCEEAVRDYRGDHGSAVALTPAAVATLLLPYVVVA